MANALYPAAKTGLMTGLVDLDTAVIKVALVRSYTYNSAHTFVSDATGAGASIVGTPQALSSVTVSGGVFDAADVIFSTVTAGASIPALLVYQSSAVTGGADVASSAQRLLLYIDTGTGLPITPTGVNINVLWDNGSNKIFSL